MPDIRRTALSILNRLEDSDHTLDRAMEDAIGRHSSISKRDRSFAHSLVYGTLRWRNRLDWIIAYFSKTPIHRIDPRILNILRIGAYQIICLDRVPASAAVNTAVELSKQISRHWAPGFVNGILRQTARQHDQVPFPDERESTSLALATGCSFPEWLAVRWIDRYGASKTRSLVDLINTIPPITIRTNTLKVDREELLASVRDDVEEIRATTYSPEGLSSVGPRRPIGTMPAFRRGWFQVQDEAAQLAGRFMDPQPGETVLDACAGLGGKTGNMAALMRNTGRIVALDKDSRKLALLDAEMGRLGITIVAGLTHDLEGPLGPEHLGQFDRVLLDAPCSGLGVLRRHPDAKWSRKAEDLARNRRRQLAFLENLVPLVKPGGILSYTVCSLEPEETDEVVEAFLSGSDRFSLRTGQTGLTGEAARFIASDGCLRTYPDARNMDGFFSASFTRDR